MPAAWFAALFARHSALQAAADFCCAKAECEEAIAPNTIAKIAAMDNVLILGSCCAVYAVGGLAASVPE